MEEKKERDHRMARQHAGEDKRRNAREKERRMESESGHEISLLISTDIGEEEEEELRRIAQTG